MLTLTRFIVLIGMVTFSCLFTGSMLFSVKNIYLHFDLNDFSTMKFRSELFWNSVLWCSLFIIPATIIAGTPIGDKIAGLFFATRKMSLREEEQVNPALDQLKKLYHTKHGGLLSAKPYVMDVPNINGMALGRETVAVSTGLLKVGSDEEIAAILAHEMGHLHYRDGLFGLSLLVASIATLWLHNIMRVVFTPILLPSSMQIDVIFCTKIFIAMLVLMMFSYGIGFFLLSFVVLWVLGAVESAVEWPIEYRADKFAADLGFAPALITLFERIEDEDIRADVGFLTKYLYSHPPMALRIDRLERHITKGENYAGD